MKFVPLLLLLLFSSAVLRAQEPEEFDNYKLKLTGYWFYSYPTGNIKGHTDSVPVDFHEDLGFSSYNTGVGKLDWKFTHKNHFYLVVIPLFTTKTYTLNRTITFQGQTFDVGTTVKSDLHAWYAAPGYQYDIIRRKRGHLGLGVQINVFNTSAKISATAPVTSGGSASGSLLAPIPVAGPEFRLYLTNSPRVFVEGNVFGMYFFGYGSFVSSAGDIGITLNKHVTINAGYSLASHLTVNVTQDRLGLQLSQKGPLAGMQFSF